MLHPMSSGPRVVSNREWFTLAKVRAIDVARQRAAGSPTVRKWHSNLMADFRFAVYQALGWPKR